MLWRRDSNCIAYQVKLITYIDNIALYPCCLIMQRGNNELIMLINIFFNLVCDILWESKNRSNIKAFTQKPACLKTHLLTEFKHQNRTSKTVKLLEIASMNSTEAQKTPKQIRQEAIINSYGLKIINQQLAVELNCSNENMRQFSMREGKDRRKIRKNEEKLLIRILQLEKWILYNKSKTNHNVWVKRPFKEVHMWRKLFWRTPSRVFALWKEDELNITVTGRLLNKWIQTKLTLLSLRKAKFDRRDKNNDILKKNYFK